MVGSDLLNRHAATDRLHGDPGLELGAVGAAFDQLLRRRLRQRWAPLSGAVPRLKGERWGLSRKVRPPHKADNHEQ